MFWEIIKLSDYFHVKNILKLIIKTSNNFLKTILYKI